MPGSWEARELEAGWGGRGAGSACSAGGGDGAGSPAEATRVSSLFPFLSQEQVRAPRAAWGRFITGFPAPSDGTKWNPTVLSCAPKCLLCSMGKPALSSPQLVCSFQRAALQPVNVVEKCLPCDLECLLRNVPCRSLRKQALTHSVMGSFSHLHKMNCCGPTMCRALNWAQRYSYEHTDTISEVPVKISELSWGRETPNTYRNP